MLTRRAGFTLIELLVGIALASLVGAAIVQLLVRQQRFYNSTNDATLTRQQLRQAAAILPADLKGISSVGGDIYLMTDSSLEFRSAFGSSVVCTNLAGKLSTVPQSLAKGSVMSSWSMPPSPGDSVAVYNDGASINVTDDAWSRYQISVVTLVAGNVANGCPTSSGLVQPSDLTGSNPSYQLTFVSAASGKIRPGAAMRFFRRVRYRLYKDTDNKWYLGYHDCKTGRSPVCNTTKPIAGPFQPYATNGTSGVQFAYYDATGAVTAIPANVMRISLVVRGQGAGLVNFTGTHATTFGDSMRIEIGLRNRN